YLNSNRLARGRFNTIDFPDGDGAFAHRQETNTQLNTANLSEYFFARFIGYIEIPVAGTYQFYVGSDDGFRLKIDGNVVSEYRNPRGYGETT
ncbi:TPA: hypothetical protein EYO57_33155, partial [Candidatus Poribacteria bacterium]|nr:hypothetical protein [Candidatus Poribacteria bacterium]